MEKQNKNDIVYASFSYRMAASVIDTILSFILVVPIIKFFANIFDISKPTTIYLQAQQMTTADIINAMNEALPALLMESTIMSAIVITFWIAKGGTPGKMLLKMKIVDAKTLEKPGSIQSVVRYLGYFASFLPFLLGFIWIYYDKKKQGFHDKIAGTIVIIEKKDKNKEPDIKS
jgi:uncharacterized RDD family membrane protein YckC